MSRVRLYDHWFIMFFSAQPRWYQPYGRFVHPRYRHLCMVQYDEEVDRFIALEIFGGGGQMKMMMPYQFIRMEDMATEVLTCMSAVDPYRPYLPRLFTCVSFCKQMLGLRWPLVITPYQLRCTLLREGIATKYESKHPEGIKNGVYGLETISAGA
jgi:hypothetical protein